MSFAVVTSPCLIGSAGPTPSAVASPAYDKYLRRHPAGWRINPDSTPRRGVAGQVDLVMFLLSDRSGVVTGSVIDWDQNVLGGFD